MGEITPWQEERLLYFATELQKHRKLLSFCASVALYIDEFKWKRKISICGNTLCNRKRI